MVPDPRVVPRSFALHASTLGEGVVVGEQDSARFESAAVGARRHGEDKVIGRYGSGTTAAWALKSVVIAAVVAVLGYLMGGWSTAVIFFVVWAASAVVLRVYAKRLESRRNPR